ncbi:hypothetical protein PIB30_060590 [Stylosanthes scabra]|uniref:Uncharacterized protein n=1 Tax=Stylosanthes scabra TaxID=79078 RepID=A0ABU6ZJ87_9FABA|nr:hypothetical protein [Stylosanthes scabra]
MPNPAGYGELTRSVIIANPTDPELALDNHRSYFPGGPFFLAPIVGQKQKVIFSNRFVALASRLELLDLENFENSRTERVDSVSGGIDSSPSPVKETELELQVESIR